MRKYRVLQSFGLLLVSVIWLGLGACSPRVTKKGEGQPCQALSECEDGLECRDLVCAPKGSNETGGSELPSSYDFPVTEIPAEPVVSPEEPSSDAGISPETQPEPDTPERIEPTTPDAPDKAPEIPGEQSSDTTGIPTGMFQRCTVQSTCSTGLSCVDGFCVKPCYRFNDPIDCPDPARFVCSSKSVCTLYCRDASGNDDSLLCPVGLRCETGECVPGARIPQGVKKEGESCKPGDCDGTRGLVCLTQSGVCVGVCDPRLGGDTNPSCRSTEECVDESRFSLVATSFLQGVCVPKPSRQAGETCDSVNQRCQANLRCVQSGATRICRTICSLQGGTSLNVACSTREYCDGGGLPDPQGICLPLPAKPTGGTGGLGDACQAGSCDSSKFLFCDAVEKVCVRGCRPKDGVTQNSLCSLTEVCIEERSYNRFAGLRSFLGGRCVAPATQNEGDVCDELKQRCRSGLRCWADRCYHQCDIAKGGAGNPDCPAQPAHACVDTQQGFSVCRTICDPRKGQATNPVCGVGQYCDCLDGQCCAAGQCPAVVFCAHSSLFSSGPRKAGETCSPQDPNQQCDGARKLFCRLGRCETSCDPRQGKVGNPNCTATQECVVGVGISEGSPLQGMCVPKGTRLSGQACDSKDRCADPLVCVGGLCELPCDPNNGQVNNAACDFTRYCRAIFQGVSGAGVCTPLPKGRTGKRKLAERCTHSFAFPAKSCDESQGLTCDPGLGRCVKACQPRDGVVNNPKCALQEECVEDVTSYLGGVCAPPTSQTLGQRCNATQQRCVQGLTCYQGLCHRPCNPANGQTSNRDCPAQGFQCVSLPGFDRQGQGVCIKQCNPAQGITANPACSTNQICVGLNNSRTAGLCQPTSAPSNGTRKVNETCNHDDPDLRCAPQLVCAKLSGTNVCTPECDPVRASNACSSGLVCITSTISSKGAYCTTPF